MTNNEIIKIENLLTEINKIRKRADEEAEARGENFNIFQILKLETDEVRLHTRFIIELLSPKGTHGLKTKPLELFIKMLVENDKKNQLNLKSFDFSIPLTKVNVHGENFGPIKNIDGKDFGGEIDIFIEMNSFSIAIENKVNAPDQKKQLLRYFNSLNNGEYPQKTILFYLTLDGKKASPFSTDNKIKAERDYFLLAYNKQIITWLEKCHNFANEVSKSIVSETIWQYLVVIKKLTGQLQNKTMQEKLVNLITENYEIGKLVHDNWEEVMKRLRERIMVSIKSDLEKTKLFGQSTIYILENKNYPHLRYKQDNWGEKFEICLEVDKFLKGQFELGIIRGEKFSNLPEIQQRLKKFSFKQNSYKEYEWISNNNKTIEITEDKLKNIDSFIEEISSKIKKHIKGVNSDWNGNN